MNMPWDLARQTARVAAKPLEAVEVLLAEGLGLALASGVRALASQPTCDTSAMDGYAVAGSGPWVIVGRVAAGDPVPGLRLRMGEAFGVATGAPVPDGSDLVIPVERCSVESGLLPVATSAQSSRTANHTSHPHQTADRHPDRHIRAAHPHPGHQISAAALHPFNHAQTAHPHAGDHLQAAHPQPGDHAQATLLQPGKHIRRRGEDWSAGDELIPAGSLITPTVLGLAAGAGHDSLLVHRRPRVAVIVTGDELLQTGPPRPGRVRDAIAPMLPGLLPGADLNTTHLNDDPNALANTLTSTQADVLVTCGATSVGPADHLRRVLNSLDAEILVSGVACRPGHPMLLAVLPDGRCVTGLPGNPFAALAAVLTLLQPLLGTLGGHTTRPPITAQLQEINAHATDTRLVPVTRTGNQAIPVGHDRPGSLWGAAKADALAVVPPNHTSPEVELLTYESAS